MPESEKPEKEVMGAGRACPACGAATSVEGLATVRVERCPECQALWFERDELRRVAAARMGKDLIDDRRLWEDAERFKGRLSDRCCPDCCIALVELKHSENAPVVEMCPRCAGVLLEKGELRVLLSALAEEGVLDIIEDALGGRTPLPQAADRIGRHFSDAMLRLAAELENHHPYISGIIRGMEQALG